MTLPECFALAENFALMIFSVKLMYDCISSVGDKNFPGFKGHNKCDYPFPSSLGFCEGGQRRESPFLERGLDSLGQ